MRDDPDDKLEMLGCVFGLFLSCAAISLFIPAFVLLISAVTMPGILVAIACLSFCAIPLAWSRKPLMIFFAAASAVSLGIAYCLTPTGETKPDAAFQTRYLGDPDDYSSAHYRRASISNIVPEIDQHLMGSRVFGSIDPLIDKEKATRLRDSLKAVYLPMREDPDFLAAPNAMGQCYASIGMPARKGHCFTYIPTKLRRDGTPIPTLVFLHGSLGNFKGYYWVLKPLADRLGMAIVGPTYGAGNWNRKPAMEELQGALDFIHTHPLLDAENIHLAGISNGALGVTRALSEFPETFTSASYLSPVLKRSAPETLPAILPPILVTSGEADVRVPKTYLEPTIEILRDQGHDITAHFIPAADHFVLFSDPDAVISELESHLVSSQSK